MDRREVRCGGLRPGVSASSTRCLRARRPGGLLGFVVFVSARVSSKEVSSRRRGDEARDGTELRCSFFACALL
jgi:hypothetical protein